MYSYFRREPVEDPANIIATIPLGTKVGYIEETNGTFSKIKYNGTIGYAKSIYLERYQSSYSPDLLEVCNVENSIYLRSTPEEKQGNIICEIPVGCQVEFVSVANSVFYKIRWNGKVGYSKAEYLR